MIYQSIINADINSVITIMQNITGKDVRLVGEVCPKLDIKN